MFWLKSLFSSALLLLPLVVMALNPDQAMKDRMNSDLDIIRNAFDVQYAPKEWKFSYAAWDLDQEIAKAKERVQNTPSISTKAYQRIVLDFFNTTKDYHVGVEFYSTERAYLPFRVKSVNGKYFVSYIDTKRLSYSVHHLNLGDEVVVFDGRPTHDVVQELIESQTIKAHAPTDLFDACLMLTGRSGRMGHIVPHGPVTIGFKRPKSDQVIYHQLIWDYTPEIFTNGLKGASRDYADKNTETELKQMLAPRHGYYRDVARDVGAGKDLPGSRESYIPPLGRIWWQTDNNNPFHAYLFETEDRHLIGYVRIPIYQGGSEEVAEFAKIIAYLEERSDALVIDQINNPGGSLLYGYGLLSLLTDQPLATPKERVSITQKDVAHALVEIADYECVTNDEEARDLLGDVFFGMPVTYQMVQFFLDYKQFIVSEWKQGRTLSQPYFIEQFDYINPNPSVQYTKPILLVINEADVSCGDFIPAILQDNRRAVLFGSRTAGAGGYVTSMSFPNRYGIDRIYYTASIAERADKNPIENLGVTPEIPYTLTEDDLKFGFQDYAKAINAAVKSLLLPED